MRYQGALITDALAGRITPRRAIAESRRINTKIGKRGTKASKKGG